LYFRLLAAVCSYWGGHSPASRAAASSHTLRDRMAAGLGSSVLPGPAVAGEEPL
jgi:hypothetical protein